MGTNFSRFQADCRRNEWAHHRGQLVSTADYIEQMDVLSLAISKDLTVFDLVEHSWLCLPGNTPLVPFIVEAAQEYIRQFYQVDGEGVYAD